MLPLTRFEDFIRQHQLCPAGSRILLAVSGGKDSVLMAHLFNAQGLNFGIAHCNFGLRNKESDNDERFVKALARSMNVPFFNTRFDTKKYAETRRISIQLAARELRYEWFEKISVTSGYDRVALAHHQSDSAETILLNLTRGTGPAGLHGILPRRDRFIRPLLFLNRAEIDALVNEHRFAYREDSSNHSDQYSRNKIRHHVMPTLRELNPKLDQTFFENSIRFAQAQELVSLQAGKARKRLFKNEGAIIRISVAGLRRLKPLKLFLFELFKPYGFSGEVLNDLERCLDKHPGRIFLSETCQLTLDREQLILSETGPAPGPSYLYETDEQVHWNGITVYRSITGLNEIPPHEPSTAFLSADLLEYPIRIRSWKKGDTFRPLGMRGHKKLSDFFISRKVPMHEKRLIPVFENGNGDIIWVAGYRISETYKVGPLTKKVVIFETR
jgi:tRNA(Ile)-lysidine synthase